MSEAFYQIEKFRLQREIADINRQQIFAPHLQGLSAQELDDLDERLVLRKRALLDDLQQNRSNVRQQHSYTTRKRVNASGLSSKTLRFVAKKKQVSEKRSKLRAEYAQLRADYIFYNRLIPQLTPKAAELKEKLIHKREMIIQEFDYMMNKRDQLSVSSYALNCHIKAGIRAAVYKSYMDEYMDQLAEVIPNARLFIQQNLLDSFNAKRR